MRLWLVRAKNNWTQAEMAGGESKSGSKEPRKITPRPRSNLTGHGDRLEGAETGLETMGERRRFAMLKATEQSPSRLISMPRRKRPMPNRSHGTKAKSEKAHIEAEEMLDAAEVHYMCFEMAEIRLGDAEKIHDVAEVAFDRPWMCRAR
uniref:Uncharacterized protein n=1 Tax=Fagus sylvatica TaxID=28930 RepID=A0A2N9GQ09_FAGSY